MKLSLTPLAIAIGLATTIPARADDVADLKAQIQILSDRLSNIEKERSQAKPIEARATEPTPVTIAYPPSMQLISGNTTISI